MHWKLSKLVLWLKKTILIHLKYVLFLCKANLVQWTQFVGRVKQLKNAQMLYTTKCGNSLYNLLLHLHFFVLVCKVLHNESAKLEQEVSQTISCLMPYKVIQLMTSRFIGQSMLPNCLIKKLLSKTRASYIKRKKTLILIFNFVQPQISNFWMIHI